jgi:hypothetical protein
MSPERPGSVHRLILSLVLFAAWVIGLSVMAFTSAEKPRAVEAGQARP